jgi:hypothetical protein
MVKHGQRKARSKKFLGEEKKSNRYAKQEHKASKTSKTSKTNVDGNGENKLQQTPTQLAIAEAEDKARKAAKAAEDASKAAKVATAAAARAREEADAMVQLSSFISTKTLPLTMLLKLTADAKIFELGLPDKWSANDLKDALALAHLFSSTMSYRLRNDDSRTVRFLPKSPHFDAYEAEAERLGSTSRPLLDRKQAPSTTPRPQEGEMTGFVCEKLAFHGAPHNYIDSIVKDGFHKPTRQGANGKAVYTSRSAWVSNDYAIGVNPNGYRGILGCRVLAYSGEMFGDVYAVTQTHRVLPLVIFNYK